jgi:hypothetical protein
MSIYNRYYIQHINNSCRFYISNITYTGNNKDITDININVSLFVPTFLQSNAYLFVLFNFDMYE